MLCYFIFVFFFKQKTAYEMRISDWSSDVCSSDLTGIWEPDADGNFHRADNICLNGSLASVENYIDGSCVVSANNMAVAVTEAKRRSGHGWAPSASATVYLSGSSRAYLRYAQAYRFPSMFEITVGFSASLNPLPDLDRKSTRLNSSHQCTHRLP